MATKRAILYAAFTTAIDDTASMKLAMLENAIAQGDYEQTVDVPISMNDSEKTQSRN